MNWIKILIVIGLLAIVFTVGCVLAISMGNKDDSAMSDEELKRFVSKNIPEGSSRAEVESFAAKQEWAIQPQGTSLPDVVDYYTIRYDLGSYELTIGGHSFCTIYVYLDQDQLVEKIMVKRSTGSWL